MPAILHKRVLKRKKTCKWRKKSTSIIADLWHYVKLGSKLGG